MGPFCDWLALEFLILRIIHAKPPATHPLQFRFSYMPLASLGFCSPVSCPISRPPCTSCLSLPSWGSSLPWVLLSHKDPKRVVGFSVRSACYLLLGWSGYSQAPYMLNWKHRVVRLRVCNEFENPSDCRIRNLESHLCITH